MAKHKLHEDTWPVGFTLLGIIMISTWFKGLFFPAEMLPVLIIISVLFILYLWGRQPGEYIYLDYGMLLFGLVYLISLIRPLVYHDALFGCLLAFSYIMVYFMAARWGTSKDLIQRLALVIYLGGCGLALIGLGAAMGWVNFPGAFADGYIRSALQYHNATAIYLAMSCLLGLGLALTASKQWQVPIYMAGCFLMGITLLGTLSRASWALALIFLVIYLSIVPAVSRKQALKLTGTLLFGVLLAGRVIQNAYLAKENWISFLALLAGCLVVSLVSSTITVIDDVKPEPVKKDNRFKNKKQETGKVSPQKNRLILLTSASILLVIIFIMGNIQYPASTPLGYLFPDRVIARAGQTFTDDTSKNERMDSYQDAVKIIRDYPLTGTGSGGWAALYHSYANRIYWVNELHSYYLKVTVETGIPGLLAVAIIGVMFLYLLGSNYRKISSREDSPLILACSLALLLLTMHAAIDFDLSIPAIAITFFALMGAIRGNLAADSVKMRKRCLTPFSHFLNQWGGTVTAIVVIVVAVGMYAGLIWSGKGAAALANRQLPMAEMYYQRAAAVDPLNAEHQANLARLAALQVADKGNEVGKDRALNYADRAVRLNPYQQDLLGNLYVTYGLLDRTDLQIAMAARAVNVNPFTPEPYRMLTSTAMKSTWQLLDAGEITQAKIHLDRLITVRENMPPYLNNKIPEFELAAGQAYLLCANKSAAQRCLNPLVDYRGQIGEQARLWLRASQRRDLMVPSTKTVEQETRYLSQLQKVLIMEMRKQPIN